MTKEVRILTSAEVGDQSCKALCSVGFNYALPPSENEGDIHSPTASCLQLAHFPQVAGPPQAPHMLAGMAWGHHHHYQIQTSRTSMPW